MGSEMCIRDRLYTEDGDEISFWEQVHEEAAAETRRLGAPAYTIEHMTGLDEMWSWNQISS